MGLINEYEEVLIGNREMIPQNYFIFDEKGNERIAVSVIRYAVEVLLGWGVEDAIRLFNYNYIKLMKLEQLMEYIAFPSDVTKEDTEYILYLLYPRQVDYDVKRYTLRVYKQVLSGKMRYPKDYMYGYLGMIRAKICLQYAINQDFVFQTVDDLYRFFASKECIRYLKKKKLLQLYTSFYATPLEYMHDSMPSYIKNDFLLHNYLFQIGYQKVLDEKEQQEAKALQEKNEGTSD